MRLLWWLLLLAPLYAANQPTLVVSKVAAQSSALKWKIVEAAAWSSVVQLNQDGGLGIETAVPLLSIRFDNAIIANRQGLFLIDTAYQCKDKCLFNVRPKDDKNPVLLYLGTEPPALPIRLDIPRPSVTPNHTHPLPDTDPIIWGLWAGVGLVTIGLAWALYKLHAVASQLRRLEDSTTEQEAALSSLDTRINKLPARDSTVRDLLEESMRIAAVKRQSASTTPTLSEASVPSPEPNSPLVSAHAQDKSPVLQSSVTSMVDSILSAASGLKKETAYQDLEALKIRLAIQERRDGDPEWKQAITAAFLQAFDLTTVIPDEASYNLATHPLTELMRMAELTEIQPLRHEAFDPGLHIAIRSTPRRATEERPQTIAEVTRVGFARAGQVIRKASVVVFE